MTTLETQTSHLAQAVRMLDKLNASELETVLREARQALARRQAKALPEREAALLRHINAPALSPADAQLYQCLYAELQAEKISPEGHATLLALLEKMEHANVSRLESLAELAQIRQVSLPILMQQLGLKSLSAHA